MEYKDFISSKRHSSLDYGFDPVFIPDRTFDFQSEIIRRGTRKGRMGIFKDTGLGKTLRFIESEKQSDMFGLYDAEIEDEA